MNGLYSPNWKDSILDENARIIDVLQALEKSGLLLACFVNSIGQLKSIITDSDIRAALLAGKKMQDSALSCANENPIVGDFRASTEALLELARQGGVHEMPLLDEEKKLRDIFIVSVREKRISQFEEEIYPAHPVPLPNAMLILAGGLGMRLRSCVADRPKPLAVVGTQPIITTLIKRAAASGIRKFYVSVNYLADQIVEHLKGPEYEGLDITVLYEEKMLGTGGSLSLIPERLKSALFVCNADILTTVSFDKMLKFHNTNGAKITCAVRPYKSAVPFGIAEIKDGKISEIREKPEFSYLVNAAIYVLDPSVVDLVADGTRIDMPEVVHKAIQQNWPVLPFFLHEYWIDIGQPEDYQRANSEYTIHFGETV